MAGTRWLSDDEQRAWRDYLRMNKKLNALLNRQLQAQSAMSLAEFEVLVHLTDIPEARLRVTELANSLQWEKSRLSHQITRMQRRGLVTREDCASDGRGAFVVLTPNGRAAIEVAAPEHVETVRRLFLDPLDTRQTAALREIVTRVLNQLEAEDPTTRRPSV